MTGTPWSAALFDLDGTLVDSEQASQAAYGAYFASRGWDVAPEVRRQFSGRRGSDVFATLPGPWSGEDPAMLAASVVMHLDHDTHPPRPIPGAAEWVRLLHGIGVPIALVTSADRAWAEYALGDLLGVRDCFTALVTSDDTAVGKPDPAPYEAGAAALGTDPGTAVAVEDTVAGIRSALAAGVGHVIGVTSGSDRPTLLDGGAHRVVATLAELGDG
ncbi:sugar-phosphatase [Haloactinopolyspora alba]|uniref:Sugar-phosphatase n=1 Tax=Haloactinopolyspora alba TaxID=648780 RepID=A0A2P8DYV1_9ACTN|nr:HAD family phosphatase [Haloactinopolyspora alba]PSL02393.1 sugar-phosphatase [Haloactinopolyspora alba]